MQKIRYADGSEMEIRQVIDVGKRVIDDVNRKCYEFHHLTTETTFDALRAVYSDPSKTENFGLLEPKMIMQRDEEGDVIPGTETPEIDEMGQPVFEVVPDPPEAVANRAGFMILIGMELRRVEILGANYSQPAVVEERIVVTMGQRQFWERG